MFFDIESQNHNIFNNDKNNPKLTSQNVKKHHRTQLSAQDNGFGLPGLKFDAESELWFELLRFRLESFDWFDKCGPLMTPVLFNANPAAYFECTPNSRLYMVFMGLVTHGLGRTSSNNYTSPSSSEPTQNMLRMRLCQVCPIFLGQNTCYFDRTVKTGACISARNTRTYPTDPYRTQTFRRKFDYGEQTRWHSFPPYVFHRREWLKQLMVGHEHRYCLWSGVLQNIPRVKRMWETTPPTLEVGKIPQLCCAFQSIEVLMTASAVPCTGFLDSKPKTRIIQVCFSWLYANWVHFSLSNLSSSFL